MGKSTLASTLAALGVVSLLVTIRLWWPCIDGVGTEPCLNAADGYMAHPLPHLLWLTAVAVTVVTLVRKQPRVGAAIALAVLLLANYAVDYGVFLALDPMLWNTDTADAAPGTGLVKAAGMFLAAASVAFIDPRSSGRSASAAAERDTMISA